jgi:serine/threonine protein kinase
VAIKIILKEKLSTQEINFIEQEVKILSQLDCEHIVKYREFFEDDRYLFIVMDLIEDA